MSCDLCFWPRVIVVVVTVGVNTSRCGGLDLAIPPYKYFLLSKAKHPIGKGRQLRFNKSKRRAISSARRGFCEQDGGPWS